MPRADPPKRQRQRGRIARALPVVLIGLAVVFAPVASAHVRRSAGPFVLELGWGVEPPYAGAQNYVDVTTSERSGAAIARPGNQLSVEISYGATSITRPLVPTGAPGKLRADLIPSRPGAYAFRITGRLRGHAIDTAARCSPSTFECVSDPRELEFPAKDPSNGELAARLTRAGDRDGASSEDGGTGLAIAALVVSALALAAAAGIGLRRGRRSSA